MRLSIPLTLLLFIALFEASISFGDETILGHYCYTYGDSESLQQARNTTRALAIRNAIESYRVFVESTSVAKDLTLTKDLVQIISAGYLRNVKVIEHRENGRTICDTIQASISPAEIENVIKRELRKRRLKGQELFGIWHKYPERNLEIYGPQERAKLIRVISDGWKIIGINERNECEWGWEITFKVLKTATYQQPSLLGIKRIEYELLDEDNFVLTRDALSIDSAPNWVLWDDGKGKSLIQEFGSTKTYKQAATVSMDKAIRAKFGKYYITVE